MKFDSIEAIKKEGFEGFIKLGSLMQDSTPVPKLKGVYLILYTCGEAPEFLETGTGGFFRDMDPNVPVDVLEQHWVEKTIVIYIGKAGKGIGNITLQDRLRQFFSFGRGKKTGHRDGRFIWQLKNHQDLLVCWKPITKDDPRDVEAALMRRFFVKYKRRPYANASG
jgi:hypothetical protein